MSAGAAPAEEARDHDLPNTNPKEVSEIEPTTDPDIDPKYERYVLSLGHVEIVVEPGRTRDWEEFCENAPPGSIALDGYVKGLQAPYLDPINGPKLNFNHHEGVLRAVTSCTADQVFRAIKDGLFDLLEGREGKPRARVYINDCDHDTCLAVWLLANFHRFTGTNNVGVVENLLRVEDSLDRCAGAYPVNLEDKLMGKLTWIFQPYTESRKDLQGMSAASMGNVVEAVCGRLLSFAEGEAGSLQPKAKYENVRDVYPDDLTTDPKGWVFITDEESSARTKLKGDKKNFFMSLISYDPEKVGEPGALKASIGKLGPYVPVDLFARYKVYNAAEALKGNTIDETNEWAGSDTIGGTPRGTGSLLTLQEMVEINNALTEIELTDGLNERRIQLFIDDELPKLLST